MKSLAQSSQKKVPVSWSLILANGLAALLLISCTDKKSVSYDQVWSRDFFNVGSQSSPRAADLNRDGILDIVIGAGKNENQKSDKGVLAINGETGALLWSHESLDQIYGSPTLYDISGDGVSDVFIGGRSQCLKALDGTNGKLIWEYKSASHKHHPVLRYARFNFNSNALVPDQNDDGLWDLLAVNGGNSLAIPGSSNDRYPGVLILFDSRTGDVLAADTMPDRGESYMSPVVVSASDQSDPWIIFGTGGETLDGRLYKVRLQEFVSRGLSSAHVIASDSGHGFIAPPVIVDLNGDGSPEAVAISHGSTVFAVDIKNDNVLWKQNIPRSENSNSFAVGRFTDDDTPDLFTFVSRGVWPENTGSLQVMLNGKNGRVEFVDSIGCTGFSSPVAYDANGDGRDECILSINEFDCNKGFTNATIESIQNKLLSIDFADGKISVIDQMAGFKNIFTTPLLTDLDGNGRPDVVYCQFFSLGGLLTFRGMRMSRIEGQSLVDKVAWGGYMNTTGDGRYYQAH